MGMYCPRMARAATTTDAFNAVAEPRRRQIVDLLADGERPVGDLVRELGLGQPQVSKHLRVLRDVGVVEVRDQGRLRLYRLNGHALKPIHDWVKGYERLLVGALRAAGRRPGRPQKEGASRWQPRLSGTAKVTPPTDDQILIEREFAAPAHLVWRSVTEPELVRGGGRGPRRDDPVRDRPARRRHLALRDAAGGRRGVRLLRRVPAARPGREGRPDGDVTSRSPTTRRRTR